MGKIEGDRFITESKRTAPRGSDTPQRGHTFHASTGLPMAFWDDSIQRLQMH